MGFPMRAPGIIIHHTPAPPRVAPRPGFRPGLSSTGPTARIKSGTRLRPVGAPDDSQGRNPWRTNTIGAPWADSIINCQLSMITRVPAGFVGGFNSTVRRACTRVRPERATELARRVNEEPSPGQSDAPPGRSGTLGWVDLPLRGAPGTRINNSTIQQLNPIPPALSARLNRRGRCRGRAAG